MRKTMPLPTGAGRGQVIRTASGLTSYEFRPGKIGGTLVFIHGFAIPSTVWEKNFYFISGHGYPVLRFDRFGLGGSVPAERRVAHSMDLFIAQLKELVDAISPPLPLTLVGLSLGCAVAVRFAKTYPDLFGALFLIAPAVPEAMSATARRLLPSGLGTVLALLLGGPILRKKLKEAVPVVEDDAFIKKCLAQLDSLEYKLALQSVCRHTLFRTDSYAYADIPPGRPESLVWGTEDSVIPFRLAEDVRRSLGRCDFHPLEGGGHCPPRERPDDVNRILDDFLKTIP
jgi:pimeloyl-ACP methyl ester carboxylesterase